MKTFEEAVESMTVAKGHGDVPRLRDIHHEWFEEALGNKHVMLLMSVGLEQLTGVIMNITEMTPIAVVQELKSILMGVWLCGIAVGREMERQDLPVTLMEAV